MIEHFGRSVTVILPGKEPKNAKAFIQPFRRKDSVVGWKGSELGLSDKAFFQYIGQKDIRLDLYPFNTVVKASEEKYIVKSAHKVCIGDDIAYIWALIQLCNGEDDKNL